jgi:hypothetical protein
MIVWLKLADLAGRSNAEVQQMLSERGLEWRTAHAREDRETGEIVYEGTAITEGTDGA